MAQLEWEKDLQQMGRIPFIGTMYQRNYAIASWVIAFARFMSFPVYVLMHKNLGERTYSVISLMWHLSIVSFMSIGLLLNLAEMVGISQGAVLHFNLIYWLFLGMVVKHWWNFRQREKEGKNIYSRSTGDPYGFWKYLPYGDRTSIVEGIYEPVLIIILAKGLVYADLASFGISSYMTVCAVSAFITVRMTMAYERSSYLDKIDAKLEADFQKSVAEGTIPSQADSRGVRSMILASSPPDKQTKMLQYFRNQRPKEVATEVEEPIELQPAQESATQKEPEPA